MRYGWAVLVFLACLLAAPAQAAPGTVSLRAELPLEFTGTQTTTGSDARFLLEGPAGAVDLHVQALDGQAVRVVHRMWGHVNMQEPWLGLLWDDDVEEIPLSLAGATVTLVERRPEFRLLASEADLQLHTTATEQPLLLGALDTPKSVDYQLNRTLVIRLTPPSSQDRFQHILPAGTLQARATAGQVDATGALDLFVTDAVLAYVGPQGPQILPAHFREEVRPGSLYNPVSKTWTGPGQHTEYVQEYLRIRATQADLRLAYAGTPASLYAAQADLAIDGTASLPVATGTITVTQDGATTRHTLRDDDVQLAGRFTLHARDVLASPARARLDGDGDFTAVTYAGVAAQYDWTAAAAAAGLGAIALAAIAWLAVHAKTLGPAAASLMAGYARVSGQEILDHPGRQEVYERVKAEPGVSFTQLAERVAFGASALNYHLRVLERNQFITPVKDGRYLRFFDRQGGAYAGNRKHVASALRNATSAAMAAHIRANPGVAQRDLAAAFGVTASTVSWHMNRLAAAGLVTRQRDAHFTRHYLADGWGQLPSEEQARLTAPSLTA